MIDWIVRNFMYKPYDIVDDYVRALSSEMIDFYGIAFVVLSLSFLLHRTTDIGLYLGIDKKK
jgi:hypothetical protein